jgi:hypothetical protein
VVDSHFVICCCVLDMFRFGFSVMSFDVVLFCVVSDVVVLMFGAGGLSDASLKSSSPMVKIGIFLT